MPCSCSSSTSSEACQKNRYGEIVVPRIATTVAIMARSRLSRGMTVDVRAAVQSAWATKRR